MVIEVSETASMNASRRLKSRCSGWLLRLVRWRYRTHSSPIEVTLFGMVIEVSEVASVNAKSPIEVSTLSASKVTEVSEVAFSNAE